MSLTMLSPGASATPQCAAEAAAQAQTLLEFHLPEVADSGGASVSFDEPRELAPIRNPVVPKQKFLVLEVWGYVYKATYRMRLIYYKDKGKDRSCLLMGQEILEHAKL